MMQRPGWVQALHLYITDSIVMDQPSFPDDGSDDALLDKIRDVVNAILCNHYGHVIVDDHCGMPRHRFCQWCGRLEKTINTQRADDGTEWTIK